MLPSTQRHNSDSTELEVKTAAQPLWVSFVSESAGKERHAVLTKVNGSDYQEETGLLLHSGDAEKCNTGDALAVS